MKVGDKMVFVDPSNNFSHVVTIEELYNDTEVLTSSGGREIKNLKNLVDVNCCANCGNIDIEEQAWVFANTNIYSDVISDNNTVTWCRDCQAHVEQKTVKEYLGNGNNK